MNNKISFKYMLSHFFLHAITCVVYGYGVYSLKARGYSSSSAGECLAICSFLAFFLQAYLSNFVDNSKKLNIFDVSIICASIIFVFTIFNSILKVKSIFLTIVFIITVTLYITLEPLINTLYTKFIVHGIKINFSTARACGSFSYALFCFVFGILTEKYSYNVVLYFFIAFALCMIVDLIMLNLDYKKFDKKEEKVEHKQVVSYKEFIKGNKMFVLLIFFLAVVYFGYLIFDNFMLLVVEEIGGNSSDMGSVLACKAIIEAISIFFAYPFLKKKIGPTNILKLAAIMFFVKSLLSTLVNNVIYLYPIQLLQGLSFALVYPGMVDFATANLKKHEITRGQALATMAMVFGSFFASLIAGNIADLFGVKTMEYLACVTGFIGMIGFIFTLGKVKKQDE